MVEDVAPGQVWEALTRDPEAVLCDVRTTAEWRDVGVPQAAPDGREPVLIEWQMYPTMRPNPDFLAALAAAGVAKAHPVYFICRSGARSLAAAQAARAAGYTQVFNVQDGFEGPPDQRGQRGHIAGWQAERLPWKRA